MKTILIAITGFIILGCELEIEPQLAPAAELMVVDAWLNDKEERQEILITRSQEYFDQSELTMIKGLWVTVEDLTTGTIYSFEEGPDSYLYDPSGTPLGIVGHSYRLMVESEGESFEAVATMNRVPAIDSVIFEYNRPNVMLDQEHYTAQFYAEDPVGQGDCYWIKAWKNGTYLGRPEELNMAYDASFSPGQPVDGQTFIYPIRAGFINPYNEGEESQPTAPYSLGDSVYVEVHSIDRAGYDFLYSLYFQINRPGGFAELFSTPLANVSTNIKSTNRDSRTPVSGFFNVSAVAGSGLKLNEAVADRAKKKAL